MCLDNDCLELKNLHRQREAIKNARIKITNSLRAVVAVNDGYVTDMEDVERKERFKRAQETIDKVVCREKDHKLRVLIVGTSTVIEEFDTQQLLLERPMKKLVKNLPVYQWLDEPAQIGFGEISLAMLIGECGNLSNYSHVSKLIKRMGCAPFTFRGKTLMGATWKRGVEGSLPAEAWEKFGYVGRRRALAYFFADNMRKKRKNTAFRELYLATKEKSKNDPNHAKWTKGRHDKHALLVAVKPLLKSCWRTWVAAVGIKGEMKEREEQEVASE